MAAAEKKCGGEGKNDFFQVGKLSLKQNFQSLSSKRLSNAFIVVSDNTLPGDTPKAFENFRKEGTATAFIPQVSLCTGKHQLAGVVLKQSSQANETGNAQRALTSGEYVGRKYMRTPAASRMMLSMPTISADL